MYDMNLIWHLSFYNTMLSSIWKRYFNLILLTQLIMYGTANQNRFRSMYYGNQTYHVEQCMSKIIEVVQPCSQRAVNNWNLNHTMFVPSKMSTCCANWEVYDCFVQASLVSCKIIVDYGTQMKTNLFL